MIRSRWGSSAVLISLALIAVLVGMAGPVAAAGRPVPRPDIEDSFWSRYLVTEYGLSPSDLTPLRNAGMGWEEIRDYLENLYPHTQPLDLGTRQYVELANQNGITPVEAIKAYEFALRYRRDPVWFASLYKQTGSWDKINQALIRYRMAESRLFKEQSKHLKATSADLAQAIAVVYGVSGYDVQQKFDQGIKPTVLLDLLFMADIHDKSTELVRGKLPDSLKGDDKNHVVEGLHEHWSMRRFPSHLLPLRPPAGWERPQGQTTAPLGQAYPATLPGMPPFQLQSDGNTNRGSFETDTHRLKPESIATIQSTTEPSLYSPSALYETGRVSPFKAYFEGYSETIDPSTGALIIRQTDFVLPGRNGLDFAFTRIYNSSRASFDLPRIEVSFQGWWFDGGNTQWMDWDYYEDSYYWIDYFYEYVFTYGPQFSSDGSVIGTLITTVTIICYDVWTGERLWSDEGSYTQYDVWGSPAPTDGQPRYSVSGSLSADTYFDELYGLGVGWALDLPSVELKDNSKYLYYNGSVYEIDGYTLRNHPIEDLKFQTDTSYAGSTYSLRRKDGLIWYFRNDGRLLAVKNRFGDTISFEYDGSNRIARVFDTVGRKVEFSYSTLQVSVSVYAKSSPGVTDWGTALFTWTYVLAGTSHYGKQKLVEVVPPEPDTPHILYTYEERRTQFTPWVESGGTGLPVDYDYLLLKVVKHPSTGASGYDYVEAFKDMTSDDPSSTTPAQLGYFRVWKRYDELASGQKINRLLFEYSPWNGTTQRYGTTRKPASNTWYPISSDMEAWENWAFDKEHQLVTHILEGGRSGADRDLKEVRRTDYVYERRLPVRVTTTYQLLRYGAEVSSRQEVVVNTWDLQGNLLSTTDAAGRIVEYTYDATYSIPTSRLERTSSSVKRGRLTEFQLSSDKKVVTEERRSMAGFVPAVHDIYYGPVGESLGPGESRIWTPNGNISSVHLVVDWTMGWEGSWYQASFSVSYRLVGTGGWTTARSVTHTNYYPENGSDIIDFSVSSGRYEIKIDVGIADEVTIKEAQAEYTVPSSWDYESQVAVIRFEYDANHPGNLLERRVYNWTNNPESPGLVPESVTTYEYDLVWHTYVTGISTDTVSTSARYDRLGRVISYTTAEGNTLSKTTSTTTYYYDKLGRLKRAVLPPQSPVGFTPTRTWFYVFPYGDDPRVEVRDEVAPGTYQWKRETYDSLGRFVAAYWGSGGTGQAPATWHLVASVAYDEFGRVSAEKDALNNETTYGYDPFWRRISTRFPGQAEATEQTWYGVVGLPPDSTLPLTPPGDPTRFAWVRWEKSQDADGNPVYRGYDATGRLVWLAANPKENLNPVVKPQPIVKTETTSTDFAQGTLSGVTATPTGDLVLGPARPEKVVAWGTDGYPYAASWITNTATIVTNLRNRGWQTKNAVEIKSWMQGMIDRGDAHGAVALFLGQAPDTVLETMDSNCTLRRFLNAGGRVLWIGDVPMYYVGHADGSRTQWGWSGSTAVLGVTSTYGPTGEPSITDEGSTWGLTNRWVGSRPLKGTDVVDVTLASVVTDFQVAYYGPVGVGLPWTWTPPGDIKHVHLVLDWTMDWEGSWYEVSFSVQYRKVGTQTWVTATARTSTDAYPSSGSDTVDFTVPLGQYEIRVVATHGNITVREAEAGTVALAQQVHGWVKFYDTAKTGGFVRIWDNSLNGATLTSAHYDELDRLASYKQGYVTSGYRVSPAFNLAPARKVADSKLSWSANVPAGTTLTVETSLDNGATWQTATNGGPIPGLSPDLDVSQKSLLVRQTLTTQNPTTTPKLYWLEISVTPGVSPNDPTPGWEMVWYEYDALNRAVRVYANRLATELWDITSYEYDLPLDQPTRVDLPGGTEPVHVYEYNSRGLKTKEDVGRPEEIRWTYDAAGRVKRIEYPNGASVNYTYSGNGENYVTIAELLENGTLSKVEVRKNLRGWVTLEAWEIDGVRYEIRYTYDDAGNRTSMMYPDGTTVRFEYNERNQLVRIPGFFEGPVTGAWTDNAGFRYDANGFLIGMRSVNGIETTFQPDERNRLKQISSSPLTLTYSYTPGGNVASITDASYGEPFTTTYGYDGANRLISAQVHMPTGIETVQYVYDALGNRIKEAWTDSRGAIDYSYLPGNYLVRRGSTSYSWGTYGQLILKDDQPNALGGETNYDYSARRLMTQVRVDGSPVAQFFYDAYGRRVKIVEGDTTTITLYSGNDIVYEVKSKPGQPTLTTTYLAINGKYLAKVVQEGTNQPQTYFYHTDLVGSVRAITDGQSQVVARFEYEPFGVTVRASGPLAGDEVHKFTGKPEDGAIDLYYFNARYYDPVSGRFISRDPISEGLNWYAYPAQNPLLFKDPTGMQGWLDEVWGFAKGVAVGAYEGVKATVTGTVDMVLHPIETAKGMFYLVARPGETWELIKVSASGTWEVVAHGTWEERGKLIGNVGAQIGLGVATTKGLGALKSSAVALAAESFKPTWVRSAGAFLKWMENIQEAYKNEGLVLSKAQLDTIVIEARKYGLQIRLDPPHMKKDNPWKIPHLNITGKNMNVHIPVPPDYVLPE